MKTIHTLAAASLLALSGAALAAKPTSIVFNASGENAEGVAYSSYTVKCSNGQTARLTAWDNRRKWCVGDANSEQCERKQIKAAKAACR